MQVIVIGAGAVGAATAFRLAQAGARVTVLDAGRIGGGTSGTSFAWINSANGERPARLPCAAHRQHGAAPRARRRIRQPRLVPPGRRPAMDAPRAGPGAGGQCPPPAGARLRRRMDHPHPAAGDGARPRPRCRRRRPHRLVPRGSLARPRPLRRRHAARRKRPRRGGPHPHQGRRHGHAGQPRHRRHPGRRHHASRRYRGELRRPLGRCRGGGCRPSHPARPHPRLPRLHPARRAWPSPTCCMRRRPTSAPMAPAASCWSGTTSPPP